MKYLTMILGGLLLASVGTNAYLGWRLESTREQLGEERQAVEQLHSINADDQELIDTLRERYDLLVRERAIAALAAEKALTEREAEIREIEAEKEQALRELESLYSGECREWASLPVCPSVAENLRGQP